MTTTVPKYFKRRGKTAKSNSNNNRCQLRVVLFIWFGLPARDKVIAILKFFNPHF